MARRRFLALLGAQAALAGATGCTRQPAEDIVPYVSQPPDATPGKSFFYATSFACDGYAEGLLVRSLTGRPIKVDGNPEHPASLGKSGAAAQASPLSLYDPDRASVLTHLGRITTWARFTADMARAVDAERGRGGDGIRILSGTVTSPSLAAQIAALLAELPAARWHRYAPAGLHHTRAGAQLAFGAPISMRHDLSLADVVLTIESDLLAAGPGNLRYAYDFSRRRAGRNEGATGPLASVPRNRLYSVESSPTCTGSMADHHVALRPAHIALFSAALAGRLGVAQDVPADLPPDILRWADVIAKDLQARPGRTLIAAGEPAHPSVHVLAHAMNEALHNLGSTVTLGDPVEVGPPDELAELRALHEDMLAGRVSLLLILGENPVYTAPADMDFAAALLRVGLAVQLSSHTDETSPSCHYHVPESHYLESWGDARAYDGTVSLIQPLIQPLHDSRSAHQMVAALRGRANVSGLDLLREQLRGSLPGPDFDAAFRDALTLGFLPATRLPDLRREVAADTARRAAEDALAAGRGQGGHELAIRPDPYLFDGRLAHNGWLQELPRPHTNLTWDNAALMSPRTAADISVQTGDLVELSLDGRAVTAPALVLNGHPDGTVTVHLGFGRPLGFNAYKLRASSSPWSASGLTLRRTGGQYPLAITQGHFKLEGRPIARVAEAAALLEDPSIIRRMGDVPESTLYDWRYEGVQWGMAIDLGICTGCSACVVACEAENNIPVVGKTEVLAGREMHWLRIDRYELDGPGAPLVVNQPMMCVHCERAPCEYPCPVEATTHSADGLNEMTYNRCVGTRYCQNNCPYKVRRFNFFDYQDPRARLRLLRNPDVTVRSRGVMEKCTYCVQRIRRAEMAAEIERRPIRDGEVVTACQAACPTDAIVFGNINDPGSRVRALKEDPRAYRVLEELNTSPRTSHLARVLNLNPEAPRHG